VEEAMPASYKEKLDPVPSRKLLALDGGGIRGMMTIEILAAIESLLQKRLGRGDDFVLADYFDYIAGTSTGAIIATCLSFGMRVDSLRKFYIESGPAMFNRAGFLKKLHFKFEDEPLARQLQKVFGPDTDLGSEKLRTLLMMVLRNATTDSPWPLSNNPGAKYCSPKRDDCNLHLPLWQLVRASTAAPTYFPPEVIDIGSKRFIFVDGGMTMYNNPAFQLFLMATLEPYKLCWPAGRDKMLLVSIGTGTAPEANENLQPGQMNLLYQASSIPSALMFAALNEQDFLCRVFGETLAGGEIDREVGDMIGKKSPGDEKLFTYVRYNAELTRAGLDALALPAIRPETVQQLDAISAIPDLQKIGTAVGRLRVRPEHFDRFV
jgi:patatin-like phospholipase/acyl hydrolase